MTNEWAAVLEADRLRQVENLTTVAIRPDPTRPRDRPPQPHRPGGRRGELVMGLYRPMLVAVVVVAVCIAVVTAMRMAVHAPTPIPRPAQPSPVRAGPLPAPASPPTAPAPVAAPPSPAGEATPPPAPRTVRRHPPTPVAPAGPDIIRHSPARTPDTSRPSSPRAPSAAHPPPRSGETSDRATDSDLDQRDEPDQPPDEVSGRNQAEDETRRRMVDTVCDRYHLPRKNCEDAAADHDN